MAAAIYRQQKVLSHFPVCCWIDWLLMIKNCLIESGPPCMLGKKIGVLQNFVYLRHLSSNEINLPLA
jgi:hypothetical protein